ncbi:MAG: HlyD family efflux transporter periplasmic adaptor subunit [Oscillospiraceae bacterium]|jgi:multidrug efflux pump subunit AcrA (membrane-fusion protein)|nr:HlyD family efflux transporter periplasmic adaptor subunit [Oscillospiraceae bacterium]
MRSSKPDSTKPDTKSNAVADFLEWAGGCAKTVRSRAPKWTRWAALGLAALVAVAELVFGWGMPAPEPSLPALVVAAQTLRLTVGGSGIVEPYEKGIITAEAAGSVKAVFHAAGDVVRQGDLVALLESGDAYLALDRAASALEAAKAAVAPALSTAAPAVIVSPVSGLVVEMRGGPGEAITAGACARIAVGGAMSVTLPDTMLAVAVGEFTRVEVATASGVIEVDGEVVERELGSAVTRLTDYRLAEGQTASVYDRDGNFAGSGLLEIDQAALVWGVSGVIRSSSVAAGDWVEAGQPLFTLEGPLTVPGYENQMLTLETAARDAAQAQQTVDSLSIHSPTDGVLSDMPLKVGDTVREGEALGMLIDAQYRAVEFNVSPEWFGIINTNQPAIVTTGGKEYVGFVASVELPLVTVALDIDAPLDTAAEAAIDTGVDREGIWVAESAVGVINGTPYATRYPAAGEMPYSWLRGPLGRLLRPDDDYILESIAPSLRIPVTLGGRSGGMVEVVSGLYAGDTILE